MGGAMSRRFTNLALLLLVNALWAAFYVANKWVGLGPVATSAWTFLIAVPVLIPFVVFEGRQVPSCNADSSRLAHVAGRSLRRRENLLGFLMIGALGLLPAAGCMAWGERFISASNAALVGLSVPVMTPLLAWVVLGEKMNGRQWVGLAIALTGTIVLSLANLPSGASGVSKTPSLWGALAGNVLVLLSCASSCFYNVYSKELLHRFSPLEILLGGYVLALAICVPLLVWVEPMSLADIRAYPAQRWLGLLVLGILVWGAGMVLWLRVLKDLEVSLASISIYLLPFFGVLLSALLLGERLTWLMMVGGGIALAGAVFSLSTEKQAADSQGEETAHAA